MADEEEADEIGVWISLADMMKIVECLETVCVTFQESINEALEELRQMPTLTLVKKNDPEQGH